MELSECSHKIPQNVIATSINDRCSTQGFLCIEGSVVKWYSSMRGKIHKEFACEFRPIDAIFCSFPSASPSFDHCVVILNSQNAIRIHCSGEQFDIVPPFQVNRIFASSVGLIIEKSQLLQNHDVSFDFPGMDIHENHIWYTLFHPIMKICPLSIFNPNICEPIFKWDQGVEEGGGTSRPDASFDFLVDDMSNKIENQKRICGIYQDIVCVMDEKKNQLAFYRISSSHGSNQYPHHPHADKDTSLHDAAADLSSEFMEISGQSRTSLGSSNEKGIRLLDTTARSDVDLEIRGTGVGHTVKTFKEAGGNSGWPVFTQIQPDSAPGHAAAAAHLQRQFLTSTIGSSSTLQYAYSSSQRRQKARRSGNSHGGPATTFSSKKPINGPVIDTFYNTLLGIGDVEAVDRVSSWMRQPSSGATNDRGVCGASSLGGDYSLGGSVSGNDQSTSFSSHGLSSPSLHGYSSEQKSFSLRSDKRISSSAFVNRYNHNPHFKLQLQCIVPIPDTSFDDIRVSLGSSISKHEISVDVLHVSRGELARWNIPVDSSNHSHSFAQSHQCACCLSPILRFDQGVLGMASLMLPTGLPGVLVQLQNVCYKSLILMNQCNKL